MFVELILSNDEPPKIIDETKVMSNETEFKILNSVFRQTTTICAQKKVFDMTNNPEHLSYSYV